VILINLFGQIYHSIIDLTGIVFYLSMACRVVCSVDMSILISSWVIGLVSNGSGSACGLYTLQLNLQLHLPCPHVLKII